MLRAHAGAIRTDSWLKSVNFVIDLRKKIQMEIRIPITDWGIFYVYLQWIYLLPLPYIYHSMCMWSSLILLDLLNSQHNLFSGLMWPCSCINFLHRMTSLINSHFACTSCNQCLIKHNGALWRNNVFKEENDCKRSFFSVFLLLLLVNQA